MSNLYERVEVLPVGTIFAVTDGDVIGAPWMRGSNTDDGTPQVWDLMVPLVNPHERAVTELWREYTHNVSVLYDPEWGGSEQ